MLERDELNDQNKDILTQPGVISGVAAMHWMTIVKDRGGIPARV